MHIETRDSEHNTNGNREAVGKMWYPCSCNHRNQLKKKKKTQTRIPYAAEFIGWKAIHGNICRHSCIRGSICLACPLIFIHIHSMCLADRWWGEVKPISKSYFLHGLLKLIASKWMHFEWKSLKLSIYSSPEYTINIIGKISVNFLISQKKNLGSSSERGKSLYKLY